MNKKFHELFTQLNNYCREHTDEDLTVIERSMSSLVVAWTYCMMGQGTRPTVEEAQQLADALELVKRWANN